jgi:Trypsin-like peptidase domain
MKLIVWLTATTIGLTIAQPGYAATTREVYDIAKSVTAKIDVSQNGQQIARGSGFLLKKRGRVYSLITSKHVTRCLENSCTYTITTADGRRHPVEGTKIKVSSGLDLATIEFTSLNNYPLAQLGNSSAVKPGDIIYTSGFPIEASGFTFTGGEVLVNRNFMLANRLGQRGYWREAGGNRSGAMADYRQAALLAQKEGDTTTLQMANASLNPNISRRQGGFIPTAIQTRSRAISTKSTPTPNATQAKIYVRMAYIAVRKNNDRKTAIIYLQKAAELYKQDGNMAKYQDIMNVIRTYTDTDI